MEWPNFHHLLYFWTVAREGSILAACEKLYVSQPTVSAQIRALEQSFGQPLFTRRGRRLELTELGHVVLRYADEIFTLGRELAETVRGHSGGRALRFVVGVADVVPKLIAYRLLEPALGLPEPVELICREGKPEQLLGALAIHELDVVLTDAPLGPTVNVRAFTHLLGECSVVVFGAPALARKYRKDFPQGLREAPLLLPTETCTLRRTLNGWFFAQDIAPRVAGQFDDSALLKAFGQAGRGLFFAPAAIAREIEQQYSVERVGELNKVRERFYAISVERRVRHPAVQAIAGAAKRELFS
jgi:LysR family transcriptional regulator, transcriptional activator of nhaA